METKEEITKTNGNSVIKKKRRRKRVWIPIILLLLIGAGIFLYWDLYLRGWVSTDDATIDSDPITISAKMLGRIVSLGAGEGDTVIAGQLVVQLDDSDLQAEAEQARAGLALAERNVAVARIALQRARDDYKRDSIQFENLVITREKYDHSRQALELATAQLGVDQSQIAVARSRVQVIETQLNSTRINANGRGVVARKWVMPGDIVQPGQPIYTLYDLSDIWVTANYEETKLGSIRPGDSVAISVDAFPGHSYAGVVDRIGAAAASQFSLIPPNNASGNFTKVTQRVPVKILIRNSDKNDPSGWPALLPGMSVEVRVRVQEQ